MMKHPARIALVVALALGACAEASEPGAPAVDRPGATPGTDEPMGAGPIEGVEDACVRARACCAAYVERVGSEDPSVTAQTTCADVAEASGDAAQAGCEAAIQGWRIALTPPAPATEGESAAAGESPAAPAEETATSAEGEAPPGTQASGVPAACE